MKRGDRHEEEKQTHAGKGGLFIFAWMMGGVKKRREEKEEKGGAMQRKNGKGGQGRKERVNLRTAVQTTTPF